MKHTKEPWIVGTRVPTYITNPNSAYTEVIAQCYFLDNKKEEENAQRIVACVNACKDITTEALEIGVIDVAMDALIWRQEAFLNKNIPWGEQEIKGVNIWEKEFEKGRTR